ncbi:MAG: PKD domain-containing protein, partial [Planctomycetes bacterium]|nr:PKD domain-containing protein [Planctomycetota bacterium]
MDGGAIGGRMGAAACGIAIALFAASARAEIVVRGSGWDEVCLDPTNARYVTTADGVRSLYLGGEGAGGEFFIRISEDPADLLAGRTVRIVARAVGVTYAGVALRNLSLPDAPAVGFFLAVEGESEAWSGGEGELSLPSVPRSADPNDGYRAATLETRDLHLALEEGENRIRVEGVDPRVFCAADGGCASPSGSAYVQLFEIAIAPGDARPLGTIAQLPRPVIESASSGGPPPFDAFLDGSASFDPDGWIESLSWDFDARDGIVVDAEGPTASPLYEKPGRYAVTLTATDNEGHANRTEATILVHEAPRIAPVSGGAFLAYAGLTYAWRLSLTSGIPDPLWTVVSGPPGISVDPDGLVEGWIPAVEDVGQGPFPIHVRAANALGQHTVSWSVSVRAGFSDGFAMDPRAAG